MKTSEEQTNILLINCDDLGYGDLGCYGSSLNRTPNLDRLAAEGARFTDYYVASPVCSASRASLLTGCYPRRVGFDHPAGARGVLFPGDAEGLHGNEITLADVLRARGYATRIIGKWHCGDQPEHLPTHHGFDGYFGIPYSNDMGRQRCLLFRNHPPLPLLRDEEVIQQQPDQANLIERYVEDAVVFLRANRSRPFFLYLAPFQVHLPLYAPERFVRESRNGRYGACVECVDWAVGVLLHELARMDLDRRTLVIFTSDNGSRCRGEGGSNEPLRGTKGTCWEGGQRVPFIARLPGLVPAGVICRDLVTAMDLLPTFTRLAGGRAPDDRQLDGREIRALLGGTVEARGPEEPFFYFQSGRLTAVRAGRWKLFVRTLQTDPDTRVDTWRPGCALYDLESDIGETTNIADGHSDVVARLMRHVEVCREDLGDAEVGASGNGCRPVGRVENPRPLTAYDPTYPYIMAEYDLAQCG